MISVAISLLLENVYKSLDWLIHFIENEIIEKIKYIIYALFWSQGFANTEKGVYCEVCCSKNRIITPEMKEMIGNLPKLVKKLANFFQKEVQQLNRMQRNIEIRIRYGIVGRKE